MTVPTVRQVTGEVRSTARVDWWEPDQLGRPLTPTTAEWLRRPNVTHRIPGAIAKALARRGLLAGLYYGQDVGLTPAGERARVLLGVVPADAPERLSCWECGTGVRRELMAWGEDRAQKRCEACARKDTP